MSKTKPIGKHNKVFLTTRELSDRWKNWVHWRQINTWRQKGFGPKFLKIGRKVLYDLEDVEAWEIEQKRRSTAE